MTAAKRKPRTFAFADLDKRAKERAREQVREWRGEDWDGQDTTEDAVQCGRELGIYIETKDVCWSGFWCQGSGASFSGTYHYSADAQRAIKAHAATDETLHAIADDLHAWANPPRTSFLGGELTLCEGAWSTAGEDTIPGATIRQSGREVHSGSMSVELDDPERDDEERAPEGSYWWDVVEREKELLAIMRRFADWIYRQLEAEYEYQTGDEAVDEECNDRQWTEEGELT